MALPVRSFVRLFIHSRIRTFIHACIHSFNKYLLSISYVLSTAYGIGVDMESTRWILFLPIFYSFC